MRICPESEADDSNTYNDTKSDECNFKDQPKKLVLTTCKIVKISIVVAVLMGILLTLTYIGANNFFKNQI